MKDILLIINVYEGILNDSIKVDFAGHNKSDFADDADQLVDFKDQVSDYLRHKQERMAERETPEVWDYVTIGGLITGHSRNCATCNQYLCWHLVDAGNLRYVNIYDYNKDKASAVRCPLEDFGTVIKADIEVPTGEVLFTDRYYNEAKTIEVPGGYHSISSLQGRLELTKHYASLGFGYGQMSNMGLSIFVKDTGDEIILSDDICWNEDAEEEQARNYEGFTCVGSLCLDVWRWMCADRSTLQRFLLEPTEPVVAAKRDEFGYMPSSTYVLASVKPGTWAVEHYYDLQGDTNPIYARLYLRP